MDVPAQVMGNRTMIPLRFVNEFFGAVVNWDDESQSIEVVLLAQSTAETTANGNASHNPNTGRVDIMALAREDEYEGTLVA